MRPGLKLLSADRDQETRRNAREPGMSGSTRRLDPGPGIRVPSRRPGGLLLLVLVRKSSSKRHMAPGQGPVAAALVADYSATGTDSSRRDSDHRDGSGRASLSCRRRSPGPGDPAARTGPARRRVPAGPGAGVSRRLGYRHGDTQAGAGPPRPAGRACQ